MYSFLIFCYNLLFFNALLKKNKKCVFFCLIIFIYMCIFFLKSGVSWALSSVGRASRLHREGREFEPLSAHQLIKLSDYFESFFLYLLRFELPREFFWLVRVCFSNSNSLRSTRVVTIALCCCRAISNLTTLRRR